MIDKTANRVSVRARAGWVLLLVTGLAGGAGEAQAADLISNINVFNYAPWHSDATNTFVDVGVKRAQRFTTGSNSTGYTLSSVVAYLMDIPALSVPRLSIYTVGTDNYPDMLVHTLTAPATFTENPPSGRFLQMHSYLHRAGQCGPRERYRLFRRVRERGHDIVRPERLH